MAKKFFYDKVHNTKRTIINIVIIGACIIGVIICFIITSNFQGENKNTNQGTLQLKEEVTVEVNEKFTNEIFFSKIENVNLDQIKVDYPDNYDITTPGTYKLTLNISKKNYNVNLIVVDTVKPELTLKPVTIEEKNNYSPNDFVESCSDNSSKDCKIEFYKEGTDEEGTTVNYANYTEPGKYPIKIAATDESGNQNVLETELTITAKNGDGNNQNPGGQTTPTTCKYGNNKYDTKNYLLTLDVSTGGCAISLDLYKNNAEMNKIMEAETTRVLKDIQKLNIEGTKSLNRKQTAIINETGDGIVGYELNITVTISKNNKSDVVADYKLNSAGKRVFTVNKYNLSE